MPGETELDHTHFSILAVARKRHHNLGASWAQRNFRMRPLEVELIFSDAVTITVTSTNEMAYITLGFFCQCYVIAERHMQPSLSMSSYQNTHL